VDREGALGVPRVPFYENLHPDVARLIDETLAALKKGLEEDR